MFENFVSLGTYCATAASMSKFGLRSWSGPFDWLTTNSFKWVLFFLENDFKEFMVRENLERLEGNPRAFKDKKSGFLFLHDREYLFEEQYDLLRHKYMRRINRFLLETLKPTCYLRWCENVEEIEYVNENYEYINSVIKKKNNKSEIIFLLRNDYKIPELLLFKNFVMPELNLGITREMTRGLFNGATEFLTYCASNYNSEVMMKNLVFDRKQEDSEYAQRNIWFECYRTSAVRYELLVGLLENRLNIDLIPTRIIIYGAGNVGQLFYKKVKKKCNVICFVDQEKIGEIDEIEIKKLDEIDYKNAIFVVTPVYEFEEICKDIRVRDNNVGIVSLMDLLKK